MANFRKRFDPGSLLVIVITFILFVAALFTKGFTHDLLLEAGVFLVSVKLIIMSYKNGVATDKLQERLDGIEATLQRLEQSAMPNPPLEPPTRLRAK
ncbi:MAG TPA: hypothetical protein VK208_23470 [Pyrinomonadaceae bacterium]|jgi:hypothetical protein|nr:hypothetical protein [Pyrinomonadaceae bacterium]